VVGQAPEGERLELTLGDHDRRVHVAEKPRVGTRRDVQHVGPAGRAEVLLARLEIAGGVVFEVRVVPAQPVFANLIEARMEVRNDDPGVVPAFAADDLAAGEGIDSPETGAQGQPAVDPACLKFREVLHGQV
jgi:hypothetical protein